MNNINKLSIFEKKLRKANFETVNTKWYLLKASLINLSFAFDRAKDSVVFYNNALRKNCYVEKQLKESYQLKAIIENIMEL